MMDENRPAMLDLGLLLSAAHALLWLFLTLMGAVAVALGVGVAAALQPVLLIPATVAGGLTGAFLGLCIGVCLLTLFACYGTYRGSRGWTWILLLLSVLGLSNPGLLATPACIVTIIGIVQVLDRRRARLA
ncbi:MAG: hypothetical protein ACI8QZ_001304 [Chlamydiales bacterium]|jgi:hypothetical protein